MAGGSDNCMMLLVVMPGIVNRGGRQATNGNANCGLGLLSLEMLDHGEPVSFFSKGVMCLKVSIPMRLNRHVTGQAMYYNGILLMIADCNFTVGGSETRDQVPEPKISVSRIRRSQSCGCCTNSSSKTI